MNVAGLEEVDIFFAVSTSIANLSKQSNTGKQYQASFFSNITSHNLCNGQNIKLESTLPLVFQNATNASYMKKNSHDVKIARCVRQPN